MAGYIFVGRRRHPVKILVYQLLTLGVYGRVYLYKVLRELDGHEALFLDRRPYIFLLVLPFVGPFLVKRRVATLVEDLLHHDVTGPAYRRSRVVAKAWVPLVPLYHLGIQKHLNHHWSMHVKEEELEIKRAQLAGLQRSRSTAAVESARALQKEIDGRARELDDLRRAAAALREAEDLRRQAERSLVRRGPTALVRKFTAAATARLPRRRAAPRGEEPPAAPEPDEAAPAPPARGKAPSPAPAPERALSEQPPTRTWGSLLPLGRKEGGPSRAERKEERRRLKDGRRAAKRAEKDAKRAAQEKARADKVAAKAARREEKERAKAARAAEKEKARAVREKPKAAKAAKDSGGKKPRPRGARGRPGPAKGRAR